METIVIDAYNLIHKVPELDSLLDKEQDACVDALITKLQSGINSKTKIIAVFDGFGKNKSVRNVEIKFAKTSSGTDYGNADKLIKSIIERTRNKKLTTIVSSDNEIKWFARECGCKYQNSEDFWKELKSKRNKDREDREKPEAVTRGEVDYFLKKFK
jgi:predicted RNA-binding protein with PIN domain